ncbi:hypothetical protein BB561_000926 [Smittium simulii]|uniref:Mitochondrial carrier protein n=1 Tax=Smittium simulii TaxID=133385 RepID=A0A2T9YWZ4_9FUNG|nr:hypothetical protein BB561_000926 [Smittium simulii]
MDSNMIKSKGASQEQNNLQNEIPLHGRLISAVIGGVMTSTLMTPFDVVKTRLQTQVAMTSSAFSTADIQDLSHKRSCKTSSFFCPNSNAIRNPKVHDRLSSNLYCKISRQSLPASSLCYSKNWNNNLCFVDNQISQVKFNPNIRSSLSSSVESLFPNQITGTWHGFKIISRTEGLSALWRGLSLTLIGALPSTVTYFAGYDLLSIHIKSSYPKAEPYSPLIAGCLARSATAVIMSPLELARTKMQSASSQKLSVVVSDLRSLVRVNGISTLWAGLIPTLYRDVPFSAIYWLSFEKLKLHFNKNNYFTTYVDSNYATLGNSLSPSNVSTISIIQKIILKDGFKGFYSGLAPRLMKIAPACAIMISSYEFGKSIFAS